MPVHNCTLLKNFSSLAKNWGLQRSCKPVSGPVAARVERLIQPDPENRACGCN